MPARARVLSTAALIAPLAVSCPGARLPPSRPLDETELGSPWRPSRLAPSATAPSRAAAFPPPATLDVTPIRFRIDDLHGLDAEGLIFERRTPQAHWRRVLAVPLPAGADARSLRILGDVGTVWTAAGLAVCLDGRGFLPVPSLPGHEPREAAIDRAGFGVGLFLPERVAITSDFGRSWTPVSLPDAEVRAIRVEGDLVQLVPGGIRDGFARSIDPRTGHVDRLPLRQGTRPRLTPRDPSDPRDPSERAPVALDGDEVVTREPLAEDLQPRARRAIGPLARLSRGLLGEGLEPLTDAATERCIRDELAVCGELVAQVCGDRLSTFRGCKRLDEIEGFATGHIAFDDEGRLWTAEAVGEASEDVRLRRRDVGALDAPSIDDVMLSLGRGDVGFIGGCKRPALWAYGRRAAAQLRDGRFVEATPRLALGRPAGVDRRGSLIAPSEQRLSFHPGGEHVDLPAPPTSLSFSEDGAHALLIARTGQVFQSDDAGRSFQPIHTPESQGAEAVLCGATRCRLGDTAVRTGFARGTLTPPTWEPLDTRAISPRDEIERHGARPHWMQCEPGTARFADAQRTDIAPRLAPFLFVSSDPRAAAGAPISLGRLDGTVTVAKRPAEDPLGGAGFDDLGFFESGGDRFARLDPFTGELLLLGGPRSERRGTVAMTESRAHPVGVLHVGADGRWWTVRAPRLGSGDVLTLGLHPEGARPSSRELFVGSAFREEQALGFLPGDDGAPPSLVLLEGVVGSLPRQVELRARPLRDDLTLGEAVIIPGTRGPDGEPLALPACVDESAAAGALLRLDAARAVSVRLDGHWRDLHLVRLVRVRAEAACVARTFFLGNHGQAPGNLVLPGNEGEGFSYAGPVSCARAHTTPPPRPPRRLGWLTSRLSPARSPRAVRGGTRPP